MALDTSGLQRHKDGAYYVSPVRLYLTAEGALCEAGDPLAARLLVGAGGRIPNAQAEELGLLVVTKTEDPGDGLDDLTVAQLEELAAAENVPLQNARRKAEKIEAIRMARAAAGAKASGDGA